MVDLHSRDLLRTVVAVSLIALTAPVHANVVELFPGAGTVRVANGTTGRIVGVTSIDRTARTVGAVIDARDRFGNAVRVNRVLRVVPDALARFGRTCLSPAGAARCAAVGAITAAAAYAGYDLINGWLQRPSTATGECPRDWIFLPGPDGTRVKTLPGLPCLEKKTGYWVLKTAGPSGAADSWRTPEIPPSVQRGIFYTTWGDLNNPQPGDLWSYKRNWGRGEQQVEPENGGEISDAEFADMVLSNPAAIQISPGLYPDVFEPVTVDETAPNPGEGTKPNPDPDPEAQTDLASMADVPRDVIDVRRFYDWGSGWLPRQCPAPTVIPIMGQDFSIDYTTLCGLIESAVAPVLRLLSLFGFLSIVIVGVGRSS